MTKTPKKSINFSLIELLVIISVMAVLISMLSPSLKGLLEKGVQIECMNNQKVISMSMGLYQHDYADQFPYGFSQAPGTFTYWTFTRSKPHQELLLPYLTDPSTNFICPADPTPEDYWYWRFNDHTEYRKVSHGSSYMFSEHSVLGFVLRNKESMKTHNFENPETLGYMSDGRAFPNGWNWANANYLKERSRVDWNHLELTNFLFADGHVEAIYSLDAGTVRTDPRN